MRKLETINISARTMKSIEYSLGESETQCFVVFSRDIQEYKGGMVEIGEDRRTKKKVTDGD